MKVLTKTQVKFWHHPPYESRGLQLALYILQISVLTTSTLSYSLHHTQTWCLSRFNSCLCAKRRKAFYKMSFLQKIRLSSRLKYSVKELPALTASFQWCKSESGFRKYSTSKNEKNVLRSAIPDVDIPVTTISNFIWDSSTKLWPDRIALVYVVVVLVCCCCCYWWCWFCCKSQVFLLSLQYKWNT